MRVLVTWGSKRGGTEGIAKLLADDLGAAGIEVDVRPAHDVHDLDGISAVILGGSLYANRWHAHARRFVARHRAALRSVPVWMFSSGPLDDSATRETIPPAPQVRALMDSIGAIGHQTFGGRLAPDAKGFPAAAMARTKSGDWRDREQIRAWAQALAAALPSARPGPAIVVGDSPLRLVTYAAAGWGITAAIAGVTLAIASMTAALIVHAIAAAMVFVAIARRYFQPRGAIQPLPAALASTALVAVFDLVALYGGLGPARLGAIAVAWPLVFAATWLTGTIITMLPFPKRPAHA